MLTRISSDDIVFDSSQGLRLFATLHGDSSVFQEFFAGYDRAFVLPDEKEDEQGFRHCLELNHDHAYQPLQAKYGPFREVCLVACDKSTGARIGGANFITQVHGQWLTANLNYIYVDAGARGQGYFKRLSRSVPEFVASMFPHSGEALVFIEQNDPFAMSRGAYEHDTQFTGLDQFDRLRIWAGVGAQVVDFPYVQPALSAAQKSDATLLYSVYGTQRTTIESVLLSAHLRGFFGISVLKGAPIEADPAASQQLEQLRRVHSVALLDPAPVLNRVKNIEAAQLLWPALPATFLSALHDQIDR